ncbi:MAG: hypothetical protein ABI758_05530 [Candidatus Woesebacteria bacterium]
MGEILLHNEESSDDHPTLPVPHAVFANRETTNPQIDFMAEYKEQLSENRKREQVVITLVLLSWKRIEDPILVTLYHTNLDEAFKRSDQLLFDLKTKYADDAPEFGISDKVFLHLGITGNEEERKETLHHFFQKAYDDLGIIDEQEQYRFFCYGLGIPHLKLCLIAYEADWNKSFVIHENLHISFPGIDDNVFFDEVLTEILSYEQCGYFDRTTLKLQPKELLQKENVDVIYYDHIQLFLELAIHIPGLFEKAEDAYKAKTGGKELMEEVQEMIDAHFHPGTFEMLVRTDPFEYNAEISDQQWLSVAQTRSALKLDQIYA